MSTTHATTYAQAIVQAALSGWLDQLTTVQRNLRHNPDLALTLTDPNSPPTSRESAVGRLLPANSSPEVAKFVRLLAQQGDLGQLEEVLRRVRGLVPSLEEGADVTITSAHDLSAAEKDQMEAKLRAEHGAEVRVRYEVDPELLGGLRIRIGDRVIDHTVATRLEALRERLVG